MTTRLIHRITEGRTDLVYELVASGQAATSADEQGTRLLT